jgi:hypothetical protein
MIMAVLGGRVGSVVTMFIAMIVPLHHRMIVVVFFHLLIVMIFRVILSAEAQWHHGCQGEGGNGENYRFPGFMTHGHCPFIAESGQLWATAPNAQVPCVGHSMSERTYADSPPDRRLPARCAAASRVSRVESKRLRAAASISGRARSGRPASKGGAGAYSIAS